MKKAAAKDRSCFFETIFIKTSTMSLFNKLKKVSHFSRQLRHYQKKEGIP